VTQQRILFTEQLRWNPLYLGFIILGDSAFANNDVMVSIYKRRHLPEAAERFNGVMCSIRTCIEWGYHKIVHYWAFVDFKKQKKAAGLSRSLVAHFCVPNECKFLCKWRKPNIKVFQFVSSNSGRFSR
jgi:hypothetical protein